VVRLLLLALVAVLVFLILRAAFAGFLAGVRGETRRRPRSQREDLVKDPVCETYVPRRTAVARRTSVATYYFCSADCATKFKPPA
jgi:YHS domain-containing protein